MSDIQQNILFEPRETSVPVRSTDPIFLLVKADMEREMAEIQHQLTMKMFEASPFLDQLKHTLPPPTWRDRLHWRLARIKTYWVTIGRALRGDDLVSSDDLDDW